MRLVRAGRVRRAVGTEAGPVTAVHTVVRAVRLQR